MDYPRDNVFTFLFSTYKRTAGIAFAVILILAIPITIAFVSRQQDIRQRAQEAGPTCETCAAQGAHLCSFVTTPGTKVCLSDQYLKLNNQPGRITCDDSCQKVTPTSSQSPIPTISTSPILDQKVFDFNDDGKVDEIDLNILYAGFAKRTGD